MHGALVNNQRDATKATNWRKEKRKDIQMMIFTYLREKSKDIQMMIFTYLREK